MSEENKSLVALVSMVSKLEQDLLENGGELSPESEAMLAEIDVRLPEKVENYQGIIERMDMVYEYYSAKAQYLKEIAESARGVKERCKKNLQYAMETMGFMEIQGTETRFKLMSTKAVEIEDESKIPEAYKVTEVVIKTEKKKILEDLKAGFTVEGASLKTNHHVRAFPKGLK